MKKFQKRVEFVEAEQWFETEEQMARLLDEGLVMKSASRDGSILVPTLGGNLTCRLNDYIVVDEKGNRSVIDGDEFEAGYELADDEDELPKSQQIPVLGNDANEPDPIKEVKKLPKK